MLEGCSGLALASPLHSAEMEMGPKKSGESYEDVLALRGYLKPHLQTQGCMVSRENQKKSAKRSGRDSHMWFIHEYLDEADMFLCSNSHTHGDSLLQRNRSEGVFYKIF